MSWNDSDFLHKGFIQEVDDLPGRSSGGTGGGMTKSQIKALDGLFKIAAYTVDASAAYAAFTKAFKISGGGSEEPDEPIEPDIPDEPALSGPVYELATATTFDGTSSIDTGRQLNLTNDAWSICIDGTGSAGTAFATHGAVDAQELRCVLASDYFWQISLCGKAVNGYTKNQRFQYVITHNAGETQATAHYVKDGAMVSETGATHWNSANSNPTTLKIGGGRAGNANFVGTVTKFAIYDRSITETEIAEYLGLVKPSSYSVTNNLTGVTNSNSATSVDASSAYNATLTVNDGFMLNSLVITMGGVDITDSVYGEGYILIPEVTGDVVITAVAEEPQYVETLSNIGGQYVDLYAGADNTSTKVATGSFTGTLSTRRTESDVTLKVRITNTTDSDITKNVYCGAMTSEQMIEHRYLRLKHTIKVSTPTFRAGQTVEFDYTLLAGYHICVTTEAGLEVEILGALDIYEPVNDFVLVDSAVGVKTYSDEGETELANQWNGKIIWIDEVVSVDTQVRIFVQANLNNGSAFYIGACDCAADSKALHNATKYYTSGMIAGLPVIVDYVIPAGKRLGVSGLSSVIVDKM